jgi:folate-binding Fe-S cluster repair protein YgfZ
MLSLDRLHAFSLKKGCYPGQEIVARTHYLGQARRRLSRIVGRHLAEGDTVGDEGGKPLGVVIRALADGSEGIAVIQADFEGQAAVVGGHAAGLPDFEEVGESFAV